MNTLRELDITDPLKIESKTKGSNNKHSKLDWN